MTDGWVKVAAATPHIKVADCEYNVRELLRIAECAAEEGTELLVFPELCITAYTCLDLFFQQTLQQAAKQALIQYIKESEALNMVSVLGLPLEYGGKLYNCAAVVSRGKLLGIVPKTNLPNYGEFQEARYFQPAPAENGVIQIGEYQCPFGTKLLFCSSQSQSFQLAVEICEDLWVPVAPSCAHAAAGATIIANLTASDETVGKNDYRNGLVISHSGRLVCGYILADAGEGESSTDLVFSGNDVIAENGVIIAERKSFEKHRDYVLTEIDTDKLAGERTRLTTYPTGNIEGYQKVYFDLNEAEAVLTRYIDPRPFVPSDQAQRKKRCETILSIQAHGLKKRLEAAHASTSVIGISGGLDSCLALLVTVKAYELLGRPMRDILAITMPCFGTTTRTKGNAEKLCEKLGVSLECIDIKEAVHQHFKDIGHDSSVTDVVYENSQARERTQILMDVANKHNGLVIGTGDLSELALGWATYNGDHMSMYGVNASVPKTLVRHIVKYCADKYKLEGHQELAEVLLDILDTPVSPELLPAKGEEINQKTEDIVGPYELHDFYLYYMLRFGYAPGKLYRLAHHGFRGEYSAEVQLKWLKVFIKRFFTQQFKRSCLPDGPKVGAVTLSPRGDWRMPSDASAALWLKEASEINE